MSTWILYADPHQLLVKDWPAHLKAMQRLGITAGVPKDMQPGDVDACLFIEDPKLLLEDTVPNGLERRLALKKRVRAMIRWFRNNQKGEEHVKEQQDPSG
jgi:hypothetical protein